jgi:cell division protein ZapA
MAVVALKINGKAYDVGCEDGEEAQLQTLAAVVDVKARQIAEEGGAIGETRLMLLTALVIAEELSAAASRAVAAEALAAQLEADLNLAKTEAARLIDAAANRIEAIGVDW